MRRYLSMFAVAAAFAMPIALPAWAETTTTTSTTIQEPTGRLVITDEKTRSFRVGSDTHVYIAPDGVNLSDLRDKEVKVYLGDDGRVSRVTRTTTIEKD